MITATSESGSGSLVKWYGASRVMLPGAPSTVYVPGAPPVMPKVMIEVPVDWSQLRATPSSDTASHTVICTCALSVPHPATLTT